MKQFENFLRMSGPRRKTKHFEVIFVVDWLLKQEIIEIEKVSVGDEEQMDT